MSASISSTKVSLRPTPSLDNLAPTVEYNILLPNRLSASTAHYHQRNGHRLYMVHTSEKRNGELNRHWLGNYGYWPFATPRGILDVLFI